ncbi:hypothetical protein SAMN05880590_13212 [Rhizobium sp. RU35A]|uniref:hypothetical protein n=1 Tax=Rhizobium sp. RU35A TaxID=1907414 RepID=UPI0009552296|nr:hypothetical protein [Rhizobium sp. RU35A]SIR43224.1 hypothetical protein SAMN05880590_13212 [Rhizobium sp. RU35A]
MNDMPQTGGAYRRNDDGTLVRIESPDALVQDTKAGAEPAAAEVSETPTTNDAGSTGKRKS